MAARGNVAVALMGALALSPACGHAADHFSEIARGLGKAAQRAGVSKVQILPFTADSGEPTAEGRMVASRIMSALIEQGRVLVVEGDLPPGIPDPYGAAMGRNPKANVRPEAEAVVLGTHITAGSRIHLNVQLVRLKDRVVLYAGNKKVKNEWERALAMEELRAPFSPTPAPAVRDVVAVAASPAVAAPAAREERIIEEGDLSNAVLDDSGPQDCRAAADEVDRLQSSIMDIKARYIALKLRASPSRAKNPPESFIQNGLIRDQFNATLAQYLDGGNIPPLTRREIRTLLVVDGKSFEIHRRCLAGRS